jgi:hypothetical protein
MKKLSAPIKSLLIVLILASSLVMCKQIETETVFVDSKPAVVDFTPTSAPIGGAVTIEGSNFGFSRVAALVHFNGVSAKITSITNSSITSVVPSGLTNGKITVSINGVKATSSADFTSSPPVITNILPTSGVAGTLVTIRGSNFDVTAEGNIVKFNGEPVTVTSASSSTLTIVVPLTATSGTVTISVGASTVTAGNFTILAPTIADFSPRIGSVGTYITITGTNFSPVLAYNVVKFNGAIATVLGTSSTHINLQVPAGASTGQVSVTVGFSTVVSSKVFTVCNGIQLSISEMGVTNFSADGASVSYYFNVINVGQTNSGDTSVDAYVSIDNVYDISDINIGHNLIGQIPPRPTYQFQRVNNINAPATVNNHPYLILVLSTTPSECDNTFNHVLIKRIIP